MKKNLTIFCEDSVELQLSYKPQTSKNQRERVSPFSKTNKNFNFMNSTTCQTPQAKQNPKESYEFKSPKYVGIIEKNVLQRLKYYEQKQSNKKQTENVTTKVKQQQFAIRQLKEKPEINQISKDLFQKVKVQRRLSPNILQRFQTYQCEKVSRSAKYDLLKAQGIQIKNTTFTCRKNMCDKSRSPLNQCSINHINHQNRSKSKSAMNLHKNVRNPSNIGRIIQRKEPQQFHQSKNQNNIDQFQEKDVYYSLMGNNQNQFNTYGHISPVKDKIKLKSKYQTDSNDFRQSTPISMKKNSKNNKKWKVIV